MLVEIIGWGGDTDSVAAIAWGIAASRNLPWDLHEPEPDFLKCDLEPGGGGFGYTYLLDLGEQLCKI